MHNSTLMTADIAATIVGAVYGALTVFVGHVIPRIRGALSTRSSGKPRAAQAKRSYHRETAALAWFKNHCG